MSPLTPAQRDLIHRAADGALTPAEQAEVAVLLAAAPEARALQADLGHLADELRRAGQRVPPAGLRAAILRTVAPAGIAGRPAAGRNVTPAAPLRWLIHHCTTLITTLEEGMARKALAFGTLAVATVAIIGYAAGTYPPKGLEIGTIGAGEPAGEPVGVERAARFKGRTMNAADVSLANPEVQALFQNDAVLRLVQSKAFREAMESEAFRALQSDAAFQRVMASETFHALLANAAFQQLMQSDAFQSVMANESFHDLLSQETLAKEALRVAPRAAALEALRENEAYRVLEANAAFHDLLANAAFRELMANDAFLQVLSNETFRASFANEAFHQVLANETFRSVLASDVFQSLQASMAFRAAARDAASADAFLSAAMRMAP